MTKYISGVILHNETLHQKTPDELQLEFPEFLRQRNLIAGIKVDKGLVKMFGSDSETTTQGLDDLLERCIDYKRRGCHFAKWRCAYRITDTLPSRQAVEENANVLARSIHDSHEHHIFSSNYNCILISGTPAYVKMQDWFP